METSEVESIVAQVRALSPSEQVEVAEAIDRLTWAQRWRNVCTRIESRARKAPAVTDEDVDELVRAVRREKSLSARSSTRQF